MKRVTRLRMAASVERIFGLAADVERWPDILPHYRYVRRLPGVEGERRFAMGARRGPIPVRWEAIQRPEPAERSVEFVHTGGVTRGMRAVWRLRPTPDGSVDVSIEHDLRLGWPLVGEPVARWVIGPQFIEPIARRTLRRVKELAEQQPEGEVAVVEPT